MDPCVHIPVHKCGILLRVGGTRQRLSPRCDTGAGVARGRSVKENARRRKKREEDEGRGLVDESNRRREEGTGNLSEERRLRATRDLFAWAKSLRAVLVYIYIYIFRAGNTPTGGWCILNSCRRILIHQFHVSGKERGEGWLAEREREREKGVEDFFPHC